MRRNCTQCTRWRTVVDFEVVLHRPTGKEYVRRICKRCERERKNASYHRMTNAQKAATAPQAAPAVLEQTEARREARTRSVQAPHAHGLIPSSAGSGG